MSDIEDEYIVTRKRVGGGFKDVVVKKPAEKQLRKSTKVSDAPSSRKESESEKQDVESKENDDEEAGKEHELRLPLSRENLQTPNSCDGTLRYDDYPILRYIQESVIGHKLVMDGPFGPKRVVYCDYTASGRSLTFIEDYIRNYVLPMYANTHSETGRNARQTQKFREEARSIIKRCVNAGKDDVVIFSGSGSTSGIHKLAWSLKINQPRVADETVCIADETVCIKVVITGPFEHHSNVLIWKELGTTVVRLKDNSQGTVDPDMLEKELKFWKEKKRLLLVSISAASNVTGIIIDTDVVARIAHQHGALVAFDYAGGGPYLNIDMNSSKQCYKDAIYISPHKFVGGPGTPGVLVAKRWMFKNSIPDRVGGGTVVYVTRDTHAYTSNIEGREEGGTPAIIESIRTGLAFLLKEAVTEHVIMSRDEDLCRRAFAVWERNPNLIILGNHNTERVTIFSFVVKHEDTGKFIHFNFISTLLNDVFGIQSRGGCACAGPYVHDLLGITETMAKRLKWFVDEYKGKSQTSSKYQLGIMRPGFVRVNLPYFYDDETVDYIINAVDMVATHGWKLLPQYTFETNSGNFTYKGQGHGNQSEDEALFSLQDIDCKNYGKFHVNRELPKNSDHVTLVTMMADAKVCFQEALDNIENSICRPSTASRDLKGIVPKDRQKLRWFMTPQEVINFVTGTGRVKHFKPIMTPRLDFREKDWFSAPGSYNRPPESRTRPPPRRGKSNEPIARDDFITTNHNNRTYRRDIIRNTRKLPPLGDSMKENGQQGQQSARTEYVNKEPLIFQSNTDRAGSIKRRPRRLAGYDSDNESYLLNDSQNKKNRTFRNVSKLTGSEKMNRSKGRLESDTEDEGDLLENTWPKANRHASRRRHNNTESGQFRFRGNHSSLPRRRFEDVRLPEL